MTATIPTFATLEDLFELIPRLRPSIGKQSINPDVIVSLLEFQHLKVEAVCKNNGYAITGLTENQKLVLKHFTLDDVYADLILSRSPEVRDEHLQSVLQQKSAIIDQKLLVAKMWARFDGLRLFDRAFDLDLPTESLAKVSECVSLVYHFQRFPLDVDSKPSIFTVARIATRYSALVYAVAALLGYPTMDLTSKHRLIYSKMVSEFTSSTILRIRAEIENPSIDRQANAIGALAEEHFQAFIDYGYDNLF